MRRWTHEVPAGCDVAAALAAAAAAGPLRQTGRQPAVPAAAQAAPYRADQSAAGDAGTGRAGARDDRAPAFPGLFAQRVGTRDPVVGAAGAPAASDPDRRRVP